MSDNYPEHDWSERRRGFLPNDPPWYVALVIGLVSLVLISVIVLLFRGDGDSIQTFAPSTSSTPPTLPSTTLAASSSTQDSSSSTAASSTTDSSSTSSGASSSTSASITTTASSATTASSSTTASSTTASSTTTTTTVDAEVYGSAVWPWFETNLRYEDPVAAAKGFAEDYVGFDDPVLGPFQQGDSRSGEVEIRPENGGPVTTAFVRQLGPDNSWWVLGSVTDNIVIDEPTALTEIGNPLLVSGKALAFEGVVSAQLRADGIDTPLVDRFVMGGGTALEPFDGEFSWSRPGVGAGAVVLFTESMENGQIWEASVVRVTFGTN